MKKKLSRLRLSKIIVHMKFLICVCMCMRDRGERGRGLVVTEKKLARRDRLPLSKFTKHMQFWCPISIFRFREALAYLGMRMRPTFWKEIDKQEAETK